jgi:hypothetical protein
MTTERLSSKIATLKDEMKRLKNLEARMLATPGQQISLTDPMPVGNTNMFLRTFSVALTNTRRRCADGVKQLSIPLE